MGSELYVPPMPPLQLARVCSPIIPLRSLAGVPPPCSHRPCWPKMWNLRTIDHCSSPVHTAVCMSWIYRVRASQLVRNRSNSNSSIQMPHSHFLMFPGTKPLTVVGSRLGLIVVDGDLMGRAFPELQVSGV